MRSFLAIGLSFVAGSAMTVLGGGSSANAQSEETASASLAQADALQTQANNEQERAANLAKQGGGAMAGDLTLANAKAARLQDDADAARAKATGAEWAPLAVSPALSDEEAKLASLKQQGGWAYKSGAIRYTEAEIQHLKGPSAYASIPDEATPLANWGKPVEQLENPSGEAFTGE